MKLMGRLIWLFILLGSFAFAVGSYYANLRDEAEQADRLAIQITARLTDQLTVLQGVRALFEITPPQDDLLIRSYLRALHQQTISSGFQGVGVALGITPQQVPQVEARIAAAYGVPVSIWPATDSDRLYPIILMEPYDPQNRAALAFDMFSDPTRRRALQRAWITGEAAASGIVHLIQDEINGLHEPGFLIYLPVAPPSRPPFSSPSIDREVLPAFVYAPVRIRDLMETTFAPQLPGISGVSVYAGTREDSPLVYQRGHIGWSPQRVQIRIADTQWTAVISYDRPFSRYVRPIIVALLGIVLALLTVQLGRIQRRRLGALRVLAEEKARHAEDRELMLGEMVHRLKNAFARVGALARITIRESNALPDFEQKFEGRLRALADTKQMMIVGTMETLDLSRLIRRELELAGCPDETITEISGPMVHLDDEGAQAIALVVHELVTNSIKYGALSGTGQLQITWTRAENIIRLLWVEANLNTTPALQHESFGSHFIRSLIQRTLRGDWERTADDRKLIVQINWKESENAPPPNRNENSEHGSPTSP